MMNWIEMVLLDPPKAKRGHVFEAVDQVATKWVWNYM